jgi:hypothetical protein
VIVFVKTLFGFFSLTTQAQTTREYKDLERDYGWLSGKSSEDQNPIGGCGAKESHEV